MADGTTTTRQRRSRRTQIEAAPDGAASEPTDVPAVSSEATPPASVMPSSNGPVTESKRRGRRPRAEAAGAPAEAPAAPTQQRSGRSRTEIASEVAPEPAEVVTTPDETAPVRTGLLDEAAPMADPVASDALTARPQRRKRRPRAGTAPRHQQAPVAVPSPAQALERAVPAQAEQATPQVADHSFEVLRRLWAELHPQGRRAAMHYMAALLVEV